MKIRTRRKRPPVVNESRIDMPQVRKADWDEFLAYAREHTTLTREDAVDPHDLHAVQSEWSQDRVDGIPMEKLGYPILVSRDGYVLDGNHRWVKAGQEGVTIPVLRLGLDRDDALTLLRSFPKSEYVKNSNPEGCNQYKSCDGSSETGWKTVMSKERGGTAFGEVKVGVNQPPSMIGVTLDSAKESRGWGKGLMYGGNLYTWPESESESGHHGGVAEALGLPSAKHGKEGYRKIYLRKEREGELQIRADSDEDVKRLSERFPGVNVTRNVQENLSPRAKRKLTRNARKKTAGPNKIDPTQTTSMRRAFTQAMRKQFSILRGRLRKFVVDEDSFGLAMTTMNAFCATGEGGGIDNSCSAVISAGKATGTEHVHLLGKDETLLASKSGDEGSVDIPYHELTSKEGAGLHAIHNHPDDSNLSPQDFKEMAKYPGIDKITAVGHSGKVHTATITGDRDQIYRAVNAYELSVKSRAIDRYIRGEDKVKIVKDRDDELGNVAEHLQNLGLIQHQITKNSATQNKYQFKTSPQKIEAFQDWLRGQLRTTVISPSNEQLWKNYAHQGYLKGAGRAFDDVNKKAPRRFGAGEGEFYSGSRAQFLRESFGRPETVEKIQLLAGRSFDDLENVTVDMATRMSRHLTDGLTEGMNPREVARLMDEDLELGGQRAEMIARTEIIRAHAEGSLDSMERMGVATVGAMVEWSTAGDDRVCPECSEMEGKEYSIEDAHGLIPAHVGCRCAWLPAGFDGLYTKEDED